MNQSSSAARRKTISSAVGLCCGGAAFFLTLFNYEANLGRTAIAGGLFSAFFDDQALALQHGHLSMPASQLSIEGFVHNGHTYTYFPPFPALLRLPITMTTQEFTGHLTLLSMALAWVVLAVVVVRMAWLVLARVSGSDDISATSAVLTAIFIAAATGGTSLTSDASLPYVYNEVYLWAVAGAVGAAYWMMRVLAEPTRSNIRWLAVFAFVAVGSRATEGWAVCLVALALGVWFRLAPRTAEHRRRWWLVLLAGAVPLACSITLNLIKFDAVYMFPLKDQVWTQINAHRRAALAANGGTLSGLQFFTTSFMDYLRPDGIRFVDYFPWITLPAHAAPAYDGAFVDQTYRTGSVTAFMPLFLLMDLGVALTFLRLRLRREVRELAFPFVGAVLSTAGVMTYGYYSMRYTSDFAPALIVGGGIGTALVATWLGRRQRSRWLRGPILGVTAALAAFSLVAQMGVGFAMAAFQYRGAPLERYVQTQLDLTPKAQRPLVRQVKGLPSGGKTDDLAISGNCEALYLNTGDKYQPWIPVQESDRSLALIPGRHLYPGSAQLLTVSGKSDQWVEVEINQFQQMRLIVHSGPNQGATDWLEIPTSGGVRVGIRNLTDYGYFQFSATPGGTIGYLPSVYFNSVQDSLPARVQLDPQRGLQRLGLTLQSQTPLGLPLCRAVARNAGVALPGH